MRRWIVIPDSFKGSLSSLDICRIARERIHKLFPEDEVRAVPVADGGEGTVDCFLSALKGERVKVSVKGPLGQPVDCDYARIEELAVVEMAAAAGLPLMGEKKDPLRASTYGVGQQMRHAIEQGARQLLLGPGGSATNDGGCGAAAALGVRFLKQDGSCFIPTGETLKQIAAVDPEPCRQLICRCPVTAMCDIDNPLCGESGAAAVFGPQKGADLETVRLLDEGLFHLSQVIQQDLGLNVSELPGAGAAGGFGAGAYAFFGAQLKSGIEAVLDIVRFDRMLESADLVLTGEGRIDSQSLRGKVISGVAQRAKQQNVPVIALVGDVGDGVTPVYEMGVSAVFSINRTAVPFSQARLRSRQDYGDTLEDLLRYTKLFSQS